MLRRDSRSVHQHGDTLIEVLFAITVFSMVAVLGLSIMNQGTASAQRSLETSLVRNEIDAQAEAIRFIYSSYIASYGSDDTGSVGATRWQQIKAQSVATASPFGQLQDNGRCLDSSSIPNNFVIDPTNLTLSSGFVAPQVYSRYTPIEVGIPRSEGLWVQAVAIPRSSGSTTPGHIDFHIRACWDAPGQSIPSTIGTIVRLYDPAL